MDSGNKDSKTVRCRTCECRAYNPVKNGFHTPKALSVRDEVFGNLCCFIIWTYCIFDITLLWIYKFYLKRLDCLLSWLVRNHLQIMVICLITIVIDDIRKKILCPQSRVKIYLLNKSNSIWRIEKKILRITLKHNEQFTSVTLIAIITSSL